MALMNDYVYIHPLRSLGMSEDLDVLSKEHNGIDVYKELWKDIEKYRQLLHHEASEDSERSVKIKIARVYAKVQDKLHTQTAVLINNALTAAISESQKYSFSVFSKKDKDTVTLIFILLVHVDKFNIFDKLARYTYSNAVVNKVVLTHEEAAAL